MNTPQENKARKGKGEAFLNEAVANQNQRSEKSNGVGNLCSWLCSLSLFDSILVGADIPHSMQWMIRIADDYHDPSKLATLLTRRPGWSLTARVERRLVSSPSPFS
jgi:hypothetical protein